MSAWRWPERPHRVVVTGLGTISPFGNGVARSWEQALAGTSTCDEIRSFDASEHLVRIGCECVDFDGEEVFGRREARRLDRAVQMSLAASREALDQSGIDLDAEDPYRVGVLIGTGIGGMYTLHEGFGALFTKGPARVSPLMGAKMIPNMASGQVSIELGIRGPNTCIVTACASGAQAIGEAWEMIRRGDADVMIAGATEASITPFGIAVFQRTGAMSMRNDDPAQACRPFDRERDGFVMGEGAGTLLLERLDHARARGARPLAELVGYGTTGDAYHVTAPLEDGTGAAEAMRIALAKAGVGPDGVDYINAHGTGTTMNDAAETLAIRSVFGEHAERIAVSSTKSMHGHCMGAAGGIEAVLTILALRESTLPPTINYRVPDPACDLDVVPNEARTLDTPPRTALSNSFGFGGHNASLLFRRWDDEADA